MPSLRLSNPFRRNADRPSLKDRAAALKDTAARVMKRKPALRPVADRVLEMAHYHEGFVPYPTEAPMSLLAIDSYIPLEAERLLRLACAEYQRLYPCQSDGKDEAARQSVADRLRRELRISELEALIDPPSAEHGADAELLALGREVDAAHAAWLPLALALREVEERIETFLARHLGMPTEGAHRQAWAQPGCSEAARAKEEADGRLEEVTRKIHALPAHTAAGLAVKARAAIPAVWSSGEYEADARLKEREGWAAQNARDLIDACLALGGVDWRGQPIATRGSAARG